MRLLRKVAIFVGLCLTTTIVRNSMVYAQTRINRNHAVDDEFVRVKDGQFFVGNKLYYFVGTNFWYGLNIGSPGAGGDQQRLQRELDRLQEMGITNLRVMAATEGPNSAPYRMLPASQPSPGVYDEQVMQGLDNLLAEMQKRHMRAVMCLSNYWQWSGGFAQYVSWTEGTPIPYPDHGDWDSFENYVARFYSNSKARELYKQAVDTVIERKNTVTNQLYKQDPTIMAWELANEPRGHNQFEAYSNWVAETATHIKQLDPNHLVTTGSEGLTAAQDATHTRPEIIHALPNIDYLTFHIWIQNFGWYDPRSSASYEQATKLALAYLDQHIDMAARLGKPAVFEEFGIARDGGNFSPAAATTVRDRYYQTMMDATFTAAARGRPLVGINFWAWAGEARPVNPGGLWQIGNPFIGDPPHEPQGWYSVYDQDVSTIAIVREYAEKMHSLSRTK